MPLPIKHLSSLVRSQREDPTYDASLIKADPAWELAFCMSEIDNDNAPLGWAAYIPLAQSLLSNYDIKRKTR